MRWIVASGGGGCCGWFGGPRRAAWAAREETYGLSEVALAAIRFMDRMTAPRNVVTESRLATILGQIHDLAVETDPDVGSRLAALKER
ncbi:MAG: DUF3375 family protein [Actinomycetota bacterium]